MSNVKRLYRWLYLGGIVLMIYLMVLNSRRAGTTLTYYYDRHKEVLGSCVEWELLTGYFPLYQQLKNQTEQCGGLNKLVQWASPLYSYMSDKACYFSGVDERNVCDISENMENLLLMENENYKFKNAADGDSSQAKSQGTESKENIGTETIESTADIREGAEEETENSIDENPSEDAETGTTENTEAESEENIKMESEDNSKAEIADNSKGKTEGTPVFPQTNGRITLNTEKQFVFNWEDYRDLSKVKADFFAVDSSTEIDLEKLMPEAFLAKDLSVEKGGNEPKILIYHTHSEEGYADSKEGVEADTVVGVGDYLEQLLTERGYSVLHHKGRYDVESRDYAYSAALPGIESVLLENPSIEVVIDLHRDAVAKDRHLVSNINGKNVAQLMFFNGLSHTKKLGDISYLPNPFLEDNMAFSFQMQVLCNEYYPGSTRKIYLKGYRYNMHLRQKSLLVEVGAQTNTVEEAYAAMDILAHTLDICLSGGE